MKTACNMILNFTVKSFYENIWAYKIKSWAKADLGFDKLKSDELFFKYVAFFVANDLDDQTSAPEIKDKLPFQDIMAAASSQPMVCSRDKSYLFDNSLNRGTG